MKADGFGLRWNGCYWASVNIVEPSDTSRRDVYFGTVGADSHHHSWLKWHGDELTELGARLKAPSLQERPPSHVTTGLSTETLARFRASWDPDQHRITAEVADVFSGSAYSAAPQHSSQTDSRRGIPMVDVAVPPEARTIEGELAYCYIPRGTQPQQLSTQVAYLPLSSDSTLGIAMLITNWTTE